MIFMRDRYMRHLHVVPLLYRLCILAGVSSGSVATPAQYEYKLAVTHVGI